MAQLYTSQGHNQCWVGILDYDRYHLSIKIWKSMNITFHNILIDIWNANYFFCEN
jgi:hypothetical protein